MKALLSLFFLIFCISAMDNQIDEMPSITKRNPNATLLAVIEENDIDLVKYLYTQGADVAYQNYEPLKMAARLGKIEILEYSLNQFPGIPQEQKNAALREAFNNKQFNAAQKLEKHGAVYQNN